jgi:hypothetical protein
MTKTINYVYLGTNGTIISPVHLEDVYYTRRYQLRADKGKLLTRDGRNFFKEFMVGEDDVDEWVEVDEKTKR